MRMNRKAALAAGASLGIAFLAACSDSSTAPATNVMVPKSSFVVGAITNNTPELGKVKVCKAGNAGGSFDVTRVAVGASTGTVSGLNTLIATGTCVIVAEDAGASGIGSEVSISEDPAANTVSAVTGCVFIGGDPPGVVDPAPCAFNPASRFINSFHGYVVTYTNTFTPPPPPPGDEGCTPGYWKQDQHFDSYPAGITPNTLFSSIFGVGGSLTFLQALGLNGGDTNALWRHGAAAYLNALSNSVDYAYTTTQVIAIVNGTGAYAGLSVEDRKNLLDAANNGVGGCPLN